MRSPRRALAVAACTTAALLAVLASCSLDLDESLIGRTPDGSVPEADTPDTFAPDASDGAPPPINPEGGVCTKDDDCKGTAGCIAAKCDVARKACVFEVCRQTACSSSTCNVAASTCAAPSKPYKFRAGQFPVNAPVGCGGALSRCFAAVYPFVFVGTQNGVLAFAGSDPQSAAPTPVPVAGLGFVPVQVVASGSRVYFLGSATGSGATSRLPIAWADVPPDPFATKITATTVLATLNRPAGEPLVLFPRATDTALLVDFAPAASYASVAIEPPLVEPLALNATPVTFVAGASPLAASGTRLVLGQINAAGGAQLAFVTNAGSAAPTTSPDVAIPSAAPASAPAYFAQSPEGAVFWSYVSLTSPPAGLPPPAVRAARVSFLTADGAAAFEPAAALDVELFGGAPLGTPAAGPVAMLDANTAIVLTAIPANPAQTNVQFVTRTPLAVVKNADGTPRRFPLTLGVSQLAAAGSSGLGYVLAVDPAAPATPSVFVFDPACAP